MSHNLASLDIAGKGWHLIQIHVAHADWDPEMEGDPFDDWCEMLLHPNCPVMVTPIPGGMAHEYHCGLQHEIDNVGAESIFDGMAPGLHLVRCWTETGRSLGASFSEISIEFDHIELVKGLMSS
jgi:hypothetical protein